MTDVGEEEIENPNGIEGLHAPMFMVKLLLVVDNLV